MKDGATLNIDIDIDIDIDIYIYIYINTKIRSIIHKILFLTSSNFFKISAGVRSNSSDIYFYLEYGN